MLHTRGHGRQNAVHQGQLQRNAANQLSKLWMHVDDHNYIAAHDHDQGTHDHDQGARRDHHHPFNCNRLL